MKLLKTKIWNQAFDETTQQCGDKVYNKVLNEIQHRTEDVLWHKVGTRVWYDITDDKLLR